MHEILNILQSLVGNIDEKTVSEMRNRMELFLQPGVSLFIPIDGQCPYALKANHTHPAYSFIYYMQPVSDFIVEGKHINYPLMNGECLSAMSPGIPHQEIKTDHFESFIAILVDRDFFERIMGTYQKEKVIYKGEAFTPANELIGLLRMYMLELNHYKNAEMIEHLSKMIVHTIIRSLKNDVKVPTFFYSRAEIDRAIVYMNIHIEEKITIADLAKNSAISQSQFLHLFKKVTGKSPINFLNHLRINRAKVLIQSGCNNMMEIAQKCGYQSASYFTSCFQQACHQSPSEYAKIFIKTEF